MIDRLPPTGLLAQVAGAELANRMAGQPAAVHLRRNCADDVPGGCPACDDARRSGHEPPGGLRSCQLYPAPKPTPARAARRACCSVMVSPAAPSPCGRGPSTWLMMARTRWEDWFAEVNRAFDELQSRSDEIFVMGLSMGGCLALRLAEIHGSAIRGLVL